MPGPLRGRAVRRGVPRRDLVHLRRSRRYRRDHRGAPQGRPAGRAPAHMSGALERIFIDGAAGRIETVLERPAGAPRGAALVAHPHPLYGGTLDNKVVQTLARTFVELGYVALRPNFRRVGAAVQTQVAQRVSPHRVVLVAVAVGRFPSESVPGDSIVIHGERDETVALAKVFDWARPQELAVVVIPGADHFFHLRLNVIKNIVKGSWRY